MTDLLQTLYGWEHRGWAACLCVLLTLLFAAVLFPRATAKTGSSENKVTDLQKAYTVKRFTEVLLGWSKSPGRPDAVGVMKRENIVKLDFLFPFVYALALAFSYACARGNREPGALDLVLFICPLVAGLFDLVENSLHMRLLSGVNTEAEVRAAIFSPALVFTASAFAHAKYVLLAASGLGIIVALLLRLRSDA